MTATLIRLSFVLVTCALLISCEVQEPEVRTYNQGANFQAQVNNSSDHPQNGSSVVASNIGSLGWGVSEFTSATKADIIARTNGEAFQLFYYAGHGWGPTPGEFHGLAWTNGDRLKPEDINPKNHYIFVFMNACSSAFEPGRSDFDAKFQHPDSRVNYATIGWDGHLERRFGRKFAELFFLECDAQKNVPTAARDAMEGAHAVLPKFIRDSQGETKIVTWGRRPHSLYLKINP